MMDRREFLKKAAVTTAGMAFAGIAEASFLAERGWADEDDIIFGEGFGIEFQRHGHASHDGTQYRWY